MNGVILLVAIVATVPGRCNRQESPETTVNSPADSLLLVVTPSSLPAQNVEYIGMNISFNPQLHIPNWVAWELTADETSGDVPRFNKFMNDPDVNGCPFPDDYRASGYDRGHMAPAGDMKWDYDAMRQTFFLTNICPQNHALNTGAWKRLEDKCRAWAVKEGAIYIVAGPILTDPIDEFIGNSKVAVPKRFFKVIAAPYANPPRGIGFIMNNGYVEGGMQRAAVTIDQVEAITGLDFFRALPDELENEIESQNQFSRW